MSHVIELTQALVRLDSCNPPGGERAVVELLAPRLEAAGFRVELHGSDAQHPNLLARYTGRRGGPSLALTGHLDTVPFGERSWASDPLSGETDGDRILGRGTSDMKGGVAAMVVAAEELAASTGFQGCLDLILTSSEETGCDGARHLVDHGRLPDGVSALLVAEPTANRPLIGHKGVLWLQLTAEGRSAHGSMPHLGHNAIYPLARAITALERLELGVEPHAVMGEPTLNVGTVSGGSNINSVPDRAVATADLRTLPSQDHQALLEQLERALAGLVEVTSLVDLPSVATASDDPWVTTVREVMAPYLETGENAATAAYFTDASVLTPALGGPPTIICGPGEPEQAHQTDEFCRIDRIEVAKEAYREIGERWDAT